MSLFEQVRKGLDNDDLAYLDVLHDGRSFAQLMNDLLVLVVPELSRSRPQLLPGSKSRRTIGAEFQG